jgi:redox-sensing transcriptional repressor
MEEFIEKHAVKLAILCVPVESAQSVANQLVAVGIQGILNFSPIVLEVAPDVTVNNVDLALELEHLGYFIR